MTKHKITTKKTAAKGTKKPISSATAATILGQDMAGNSGPEKTRIKQEWQKYYRNLLGLRQRLLEQMSGLAKESTEEINNYSLHMADSGTDTFDRDFALGLLSADQDAIYEIEEALKRIEKRIYGVCEITGEAIPKARLDAIPWTRFTVEAQTQLERDGALRQRGLGSLGTIDSTASADSDDDDFSEDRTPRNKEKD